MLDLLRNIIFVTETWLDNGCFISNYFSTKYQILHRDRNGHGGNVVILIDNLFDAIETTYNTFSNQIETIRCSCELGNEIFLFGGLQTSKFYI